MTPYGIFRTPETWTAPYPQLEMEFPTGVIIDGGSSYGKSGTVLQPNGGNVGIGTTSPNAKFDVNSNSIIIEQSNTPADNATCTAGTHWWDANYIYVCTASGTVKRAALSAF